MNKEINVEKLEYFREIIERKVNISEWALKHNMSKQNASGILTTFLSKVYESDSFKKLENSIIKNDGNYVAKVNTNKNNKDLVDIFSYKHNLAYLLSIARLELHLTAL